jgi:quercetin dioxygenase-like cupin family protein
MSVMQSELSRRLARPEARFDLESELDKLRQTAAWRRTGRSSKELVKYPDLRIALVALKEGALIPEHLAAARTAVQTVLGAVRVRLPDDTAELPAGRLLTLDRGVRYDVEALEDSAFLLTISWPA